MTFTGYPMKVAVGSLRLARAWRSRATTVVGIVAVPLRLAARVDRALLDLSDVARGVDGMHREFVGMRADILALDARVDGLREEITGLRTDIVEPVSNVTPMLAGVRALDARLDGLGHQLESVDALALRLGRFPRRGARGQPVAQAAEQDGAGSAGSTVLGSELR